MAFVASLAAMAMDLATTKDHTQLVQIQLQRMVSLQTILWWITRVHRQASRPYCHCQRFRHFTLYQCFRMEAATPMASLMEMPWVPNPTGFPMGLLHIPLSRRRVNSTWLTVSLNRKVMRVLHISLPWSQVPLLCQTARTLLFEFWGPDRLPITL